MRTADGDFISSGGNFQTVWYVGPNLRVVLYIIRFACSPSACLEQKLRLDPVSARHLLLVSRVEHAGLPKLLCTRMVALAAMHPVVVGLAARHAAVARVSEPAVHVLRRRARERVRCGDGVGEGRAVDDARVCKRGHGGAGDGGQVGCLRWGGEVRSED